jgi:hypothetical protein
LDLLRYDIYFASLALKSAFFERFRKTPLCDILWTVFRLPEHTGHHLSHEETAFQYLITANSEPILKLQTKPDGFGFLILEQMENTEVIENLKNSRLLTGSEESECVEMITPTEETPAE